MFHYNHDMPSSSNVKYEDTVYHMFGVNICISKSENIIINRYQYDVKTKLKKKLKKTLQWFYTG